MKSRYPQAPPFANIQEIETFLEKPLLAKLCSHNPDGTIHVAPIYFKFAGGEFLLGSQDQSRKVRNIKRDNNVTVLIDSFDPVIQAVLAYGDAYLDYEDVIAKRVEILEKYFPSRAEAKSFAERLARNWKIVIIRVKPTRIVTFDYCKPFPIE